MLASVLGWIATFLFTVCYIPQIITTLKQKTTKGLSLWMINIMIVANVVALNYATLIKQPALQVKYALALVFLIICFFTFIKYKNK